MQGSVAKPAVIVALLLTSGGLAITPAMAAGPGLSSGGIYRAVSQQPVHDAAVTSIQSSSFLVQQGEVVEVQVTVANLGSEKETILLSLLDGASPAEMNSVSLVLNPGQALTVGFQWHTGGAASGRHLLSASAGLPGDQNTGNNALALAAPIQVQAQQIILGDGTGLDLPDASFGARLQPASIAAQSTSADSIFIGVHEASLGGALVRAAVATQESPNLRIFVASADAVFQSASPLTNPFAQGEIQGVLRLQGAASSLGGYVQAGPTTHFVQADGSFRFLTPSGKFDVLIDAPGYVPVVVPDTEINPGDVVNLPELTLPFGDANGDGKIDILDLSIAASNFGTSVVAVGQP